MSKYKEIFKLILKTIIKNSKYPEEKVLKKLERFKYIEFDNFSDEDLYQVLAYIPFYSGFNARTVEMKIETIKKYFLSYEKVSKYDNAMIEKISTDPKMIKNRRKIKAAVSNAKKVKELVRQYGSFKNYLQTLNFNKSKGKLESAVEALIEKFSFLGPVTVHHFLTDIGANTIKPDRVIMRVLTRLNLVKDESCIDDARAICNRIVKETGYSHRYIDIVIVQFGQKSDALDLGIEHGICLEKNPHCNNCLLNKKYCSFNKD